MFNLQKWIRPHIWELKPYASARDEYEGTEGIFLDANENPFCSKDIPRFNRYPDPYQRELKQQIAQIKNIDASKVFLGNGSDEVIDLLMRLSCAPLKDEVLIMPPTYGMYRVCADINQINVLEAPLTEDFALQTDLVLRTFTAHTKICFVCSPNNPTGNVLEASEIHRIIQSFDGVVIVDEAYIDFARQESFVKYLHSYPNLVVIQTLSKAWGMAGLRLGMCFASEEIIRLLNKIKPPYNVNQATQEIALESLTKTAEKEEQVQQILSLREKLKHDLKQISEVEMVYPSDANFLLVKMAHAEKVYQYLIQQKVIVRSRANVQLTKDCLRISVGTAEENEQLLTALNTYVHHKSALV